MSLEDSLPKVIDDRDFPSFLPVTEKTKIITSTAAQHGTYAAAILSMNLPNNTERSPKMSTFFRGLSELFGIKYDFSVVKEYKAEELSYDLP